MPFFSHKLTIPTPDQTLPGRSERMRVPKSHFVNSAPLEPPFPMNGDLFLNTVNFLAAEEPQIVVRKDDQKAQPLMLADWQYWVLFLATMIVAPLVMVGAGISAYLRRRARRGMPAK